MYPHRLTMLNINYCDACSGKCGQVHEKDRLRLVTPITPHIGWQTCGCLDCDETINKWQNLYVIDKENLEKKYGDNVIVIRSSKAVENDWSVKVAYTDVMGERRIIVEKGSSSKDLLVDIFEDWQIQNRCC